MSEQEPGEDSDHDSVCSSIDYEAAVLKLADDELKIVDTINESYEEACSRLEKAMGAGQLTGTPGNIQLESLEVGELCSAVYNAKKLECHDWRSRRLLATATVARDARGRRFRRAFCLGVRGGGLSGPLFQAFPILCLQARARPHPWAPSRGQGQGQGPGPGPGPGTPSLKC